MLEVNAITNDGDVIEMTFPTRAVEVIDGALIIYDYDETTGDVRGVRAGFAPGRWATFNLV